MSRRKTERRMGAVIGIIRPGELYDTNAVFNQAGIGELKLRQERRAGRLKPRLYNGRHWYTGEELIALIMKDTK